jgi:hypothetical protein
MGGAASGPWPLADTLATPLKNVLVLPMQSSPYGTAVSGRFLWKMAGNSAVLIGLEKEGV